MSVQTKLIAQTQQTTRRLFNKYWSLIWKIGSALTDQGIFTATNFATNVFLARWMAPNEYGAFVVAYAWLLLFQTVYEGAMLEPMAFYGPAKYAKNFKKYMAYLFYGHVGLSFLIIIFLSLGALLSYLFDSTLMASAMVGAALASPFLTLRELSRRPFYVTSKPSLSALGGGVYLITALSSVVILKISDQLTPFSAFVGLALAAFLASAFITLVFLKPDWKINNEVVNMREVIKDHWNFGIWSMPKRFLQWLPSNIYFLVLPGIIGLQGSGALRALTNLIMPVAMANSALTIMLMPSFVRIFRSQGKLRLDRRLRQIGAVTFALTGIYGLVVVLFGKQLVHIIYAGQFDDEATFLVLLLMALIPATMSLTRILGAGLQAMGWVKSIFKARLIPTLFTLTVGVYLTKQYGILGSQLGSLSAALILMIGHVRDYRRRITSDEVSPLKNMSQEKDKALVTTQTQTEIAEQTADLSGEKVSVVMPAYNAESFIETAIDSVLKQTFQNFELIVVDDGSTDKTVEIIERYAKSDKRIRLIKNDHAGACKARNTGVEAAQYDWIAMLDSDDAYLPNRLEKQLTAAQANPEVILWGTYLKQINAEGKPIGFIKFGPTSVEAFNSIDRTEHAFVLLTSTALFRKETFLKSGGFDSRLTAAQDTELWDRMLQHGPAIIIPEPLVLYRYHGQSISAKRFFDQRVYMEFVKERLLAQRNGKTLELEAFIAEYKSASRLKRLYRNTRILGRYHYRNVGVFVSEGRRFTAFISLLASLVLTPKFATARISNRFFPKHFA